MTEQECAICKIVAGELPAQIVNEDDRTVAFMDLDPATRGHALVVPRRHSTDLLEVDADDLEAVVRAAQRLATKVPGRLGADGVNLAGSWARSASCSSSHFHIHVIPRYQNDRLRLPWRPAPRAPDEIAAAAAALR
jgi:histidine triad (HIT) family protein